MYFSVLKIVAERHYFRTIVTRAWLLWRQLIDERHNEERYERIAVQFYYHTIQRRTLNAWKLVENLYLNIKINFYGFYLIIIVYSSLSLYEIYVS